MEIKKILIVRFSSIGDIVLATPVIRCVKQQLANVEIHFVTKKNFSDVLSQNPYIDKLYTFKADISELVPELKEEKYDLVIDLHKNLRSFRLKQKLGIKSYSFNKLNLEKLVAVKFKNTGILPAKHIVDRYFETVSKLGIVNDQKGLDYFISEKDKVNMTDYWSMGFNKKYIVLVVGGSYYTKQIPLNKLEEICEKSQLPLVLLGGKEDREQARLLKGKTKGLINLCGILSLNQSASVIQQAEWIITPDTGLMHIAAAFKKRIVSVWGNTIPQFGMTPYLANSENVILEISGLACRPCSKLGYKKCPKGHFKCMNEIDYTFVSDLS